jgi:hypothetical protein
MDETSVLRRVWLRMQSISTLFRVQTGKAWVSGGGKVRRMPNGDVVVPFGRPIALGFGLVDGSPVEGTSDLVGWTPVQVTPEMVGHTLPVFTGLETKNSSGGHTREAQHHFAGIIERAGGIAAIVNSPESAVEAYEKFLLRFRPH